MTYHAVQCMSVWTAQVGNTRTLQLISNRVAGLPADKMMYKQHPKWAHQACSRPDKAIVAAAQYAPVCRRQREDVVLEAGQTAWLWDEVLGEW